MCDAVHSLVYFHAPYSISSILQSKSLLFFFFLSHEGKPAGGSNFGRRRESHADARVPNRVAVSALCGRPRGRRRRVFGDRGREVVAHRRAAPGETALVFPPCGGGLVRPGIRCRSGNKRLVEQ